MKAEPRAATAAFQAFAARVEAVRALALVGSQASGSAGPDADVDLVLLTEEPQRFVDDDHWLERLDLPEPATPAPPRRWGAITERRLRLVSGLELDLGIGLPAWAATEPVDPGTRQVVANGMQRIHDPHRLLGKLAAACDSPSQPWLPDQMTLAGHEIALRDWTEDDAPSLRPVCGDPEVCRFTTIPTAYSPEAALAWVERQRRKRLDGERLVLAITAPQRPQEPLGAVNLGRFSADGREAELGYWLLPAARGRGLATAAAATLVSYGFRQLGLERIELAILPENAASRRLATRLGARSEGVRRASHIAEARSWDMAIYSLEKCG